MTSEILKKEKLMRLNINLEKIVENIEEHNELKRKELQLLKSYIDLEYKKYLDEKDLNNIKEKWEKH